MRTFERSRRFCTGGLRFLMNMTEFFAETQTISNVRTFDMVLHKMGLSLSMNMTEFCAETQTISNVRCGFAQMGLSLSMKKYFLYKWFLNPRLKFDSKSESK